MVNFRKYLQESKDRKFEALASKRDSEPNPYSCNYSPCTGHKYCEHTHCILDKEWLQKDKAKILLENQIREEESFLKNGQGCDGYDFKEQMKNVLRLERKLDELKKEEN